MNQQKNLIIILIIILSMLGIVLVLVPASLFSTTPFDLTGETELNGQIRGLLQLPLNWTVKPLDTDRYAVIENTDINPFGVNTFLQHEVEPEKRERQMQLLTEAGFTWIRQEFPWEDIEIAARGDFIDRRNDPDGVDAWAKYDHIVELAEQYDVNIIARLSNPPAWSRAQGNDIGTYAPPDDFDDFATFVGAVAERYKGQIRYYQIWNEPNIYPEWGEQNVDPEAYTDLLCRAYKAVKDADPDAVVLSGALAPTAELSGRNLNDYIFLQRMYDAGAGECFDILSMQGYGLWSGPTDHRMRPIVINYGRNPLIRDIMVKNGDSHKSIWITEMNWNVAPEDVVPRFGRATLQQQAEWAPLAYQRAQEEWPWIGVINMWYFKRASDDWLTAQLPEAYFQMLEPDFTALPVYDSMKAYTAQPMNLYAGNHRADHWVIEYGDGWLTSGEGSMIASAEAEPVKFTFEGTYLHLDYSPDDAVFTYRLDGGRWQSGKAVLYRGKDAQYTVEIKPEDELAINRFIVRDDRSPAAVVVIGMVLLLIGASAFSYFRQS